MSSPLSPSGGKAPLLSFRLQHEETRRVEELARQRGLSRSECIRTLIVEGLGVAEAEEVSEAS